MNEIKVLELQEIRNSLISFLGKSVIRRGELVSTNKMSEDKSKIIAKIEDSIRNIADQLTRTIVRSIITDIEEPKQKIITATNQINNAVEELEEFNDFIKISSTFLSIATTMILASSTGNLLKLIDLLDIIDEIV